MAYDYKQLYEKNAAFNQRHSVAKTVLRIGNTVFTYAFLLAYAGLWVYGFLNDFTPKDFTNIFFVPVLALLAVSAMRMAIDRPRPYSKDGAGITPLISREGRENDSFPSRHLTCAFVIAMTFLPYLTGLGVGLLVCGLLLGYARFALGLHYPSDLLVGALVGVAVGALIFVVF